MIKIELTKKQANHLYTLLMLVERGEMPLEQLLPEDKELIKSIQDTIFKQVVNSQYETL